MRGRVLLSQHHRVDKLPLSRFRAEASGPSMPTWQPKEIKMLHKAVGGMCGSPTLVQEWWGEMRLGKRPVAPAGLAIKLAPLDENSHGLVERETLRPCMLR